MKLYLVFLTLSLLSLGESLKCLNVELKTSIWKIKNWRFSFSASAQLIDRPNATVIYSAGHGISKGSNLEFLIFDQITDETGKYPILSFKIRTAKSLLAFMYLHKNYTDLQVSGIAVETFSTEPVRPGYKANNKLCLEKTSEKLRHLIRNCFENVFIRELTDVEKKELKKFKETSRNLKGSSFSPLF